MKNDVSRAFKRWQIPITILRKSAGDYVDGVWVDGLEVQVPIKAVVQNSQPDDLILLPEGTRSTEAVQLHTISELKTVSEVGSTNADQFTYDGERYKIYDVFARKIGNYYKAIAIRVKS